METVQLTYYDGSQYVSRNFQATHVKGIGFPDEFEWLATQDVLLDGDIATYTKNFNIVITIVIEVIQDIESAKFLWDFYRYNTRLVLYNTNVSYVVPHGDMFVEADWIENCELGRQYTLRLIGTKPYTTFPEPSTEPELVYFTYKVKIEGTQAVPETFTTGTGKLATTARGTAYPTFNSATQSPLVIVNGSPYQDGKINIVTQASISGGNVTFTAAVSDAGNPSGDGFFYADISVLIQED